MLYLHHGLNLADDFVGRGDAVTLLGLQAGHDQGVHVKLLGQLLILGQVQVRGLRHLKHDMNDSQTKR